MKKKDVGLVLWRLRWSSDFDYLRAIHVGIFFAMVMLCCICLSTNAWSEQDRIRIVCTHPIIKNWVDHIVENVFLVENMMSEQADPHTFEPTPKVIKDVSEADFVVHTGTAMDSWIDRILKTGDVRGKVFSCVGQGSLDLAYMRGSHNHSEVDPHFWMNIDNAKIFVEVFTKFILSHTEGFEADILRQAENYDMRLGQLAAHCRTESQKYAQNYVKMASIHPGFQYFAKSMGWVDTYDHWIYFCEEEQDLTPMDFIEIRKVILGQSINVLLADSHTSRALLKMFGDIPGLSLISNLNIEALHVDFKAPNTYENLIKSNLNKILSQFKKMDRVNPS